MLNVIRKTKYLETCSLSDIIEHQHNLDKDILDMHTLIFLWWWLSCYHWNKGFRNRILVQVTEVLLLERLLWECLKVNSCQGWNLADKLLLGKTWWRWCWTGGTCASACRSARLGWPLLAGQLHFHGIHKLKLSMLKVCHKLVIISDFDIDWEIKTHGGFSGVPLDIITVYSSAMVHLHSEIIDFVKSARVLEKITFDQSTRNNWRTELI